MGQVFVLGGQQSDFERNFTKEGKSIISLLKETLSDAFCETKLCYEEIERLAKDNRIACFVGNFDGEQYLNQGHLGAFLTEVSSAFIGVPAARYEAACASSSVALDAAISKIRTGDIDLAVVVGIELMKTVDSKTCGDYLGTAAYYEKEANGISFPFPKLFGQLANEYIRRYGKLYESRYMEALAKISHKNYSNAKRNPLAQTRKWFMNYDQTVQRNTKTNSLVGGRLAISDCSQVTDGCVVVFLASEKYAIEYAKKILAESIDNLPKVTGWGCRVAPLQFKNKVLGSSDSRYILPWTRQAVLDAYARAAIRESDIDIIETHDCFTSSEYAAISAFGITEPGMEYKAIEYGWTEIDGKIPMNPSGGLIGVGHPVGASGVRMFLDCYKQLTNKAGDYQVANARTAAMLNIGGSATTNYVFILQK